MGNNNEKMFEVRGVVYRTTPYDREVAQKSLVREIQKERERSL